MTMHEALMSSADVTTPATRVVLQTVAEKMGAHLHIRVSIGPDVDHLALSGTLVMNPEEWDQLGGIAGGYEAMVRTVEAETRMRLALLRQDEAKAAKDASAAELAATKVEAERLRFALAKAEAALADIGDAQREPGDDVAWCEQRAAKVLPEVRSTLKATKGSSRALAEAIEVMAADTARVMRVEQKILPLITKHAELLRVLCEIAEMGPTCDECEDFAPPPSPKREITHQTTMWDRPIYLCAEHAPEREASYRKAESKGCGKQPAVVPDVETNEAINVARAALAKLEALTAGAVR